MPEKRLAEGATLAVIRRFVLILFLVGVVGTGIELLLLGHTEDVWQWAPLVLMVASLIILVWRATHTGSASLRAFQGTMVMFVLTGALGLWLHYDGNAAFEREMYSSIQGLDLFWEAVTGATPTLAPGTILELGLLGLVYTYRHPDIQQRATSSAPPNRIEV